MIRCDVSFSLVAQLTNALFIDLQAMNPLKPSLDVKQMTVNKSKLQRDKDRMKVKGKKKHKEWLKKLDCIGFDGKVDKETMVYREVKDQNEKMKLKKGREQKHIWLS